MKQGAHAVRKAEARVFAACPTGHRASWAVRWFDSHAKCEVPSVCFCGCAQRGTSQVKSSSNTSVNAQGTRRAHRKEVHFPSVCGLSLRRSSRLGRALDLYSQAQQLPPCVIQVIVCPGRGKMSPHRTVCPDGAFRNSASLVPPPPV